MTPVESISVPAGASRLDFPASNENQQLARRLDLSPLEGTRYYSKFFDIETVNACNARFTMCTIGYWQEGQNVVMSDVLFAKFTNEAVGFVDWVEMVCLNLKS